MFINVRYNNILEQKSYFSVTLVISLLFGMKQVQISFFHGEDSSPSWKLCFKVVSVSELLFSCFDPPTRLSRGNEVGFELSIPAAYVTIQFRMLISSALDLYLKGKEFCSILRDWKYSGFGRERETLQWLSEGKEQFMTVEYLLICNDSSLFYLFLFAFYFLWCGTSEHTSQPQGIRHFDTLKTVWAKYLNVG